MLTITNLHATVGEGDDAREILKGVNLTVRPGEVHAIMGPNGSGKSTLARVLSGAPGYAATDGSITWHNDNLLELEPEERAWKGVFMAFQYPVEIPGVNNTYFLRQALNSKRKANGQPELDGAAFLKLAREKAKLIDFDEAYLQRAVNEGFSGGEKKRNEIFQMAILDPSLAILDETDSGLDIDALKIVARGVNSMRNAERAIVVITHYQRLLDYINPDVVHVLAEGRIVKTGGPELAHELEKRGYDWLKTGATN
ncbi:MAG: Fe-S cluster assembly ATPase SufC [Planctomycetota bacterium]